MKTTMQQVVQDQTNDQSEEPQQWIRLTDEMINNIGFKNESNRKVNHRSHLFYCVKSQFVKDEEYRLTVLKDPHHSGHGGHNKKVLEMTQAAYDTLLIKTYNLRNKKPKVEKHFLYVLHNPMYLHYGPNVYKVGYSDDVNRRLRDYKTPYLEDSTIVYLKEVSSRKCDARLRKLMKKHRMNPKREFFDCELSVIKKYINSL